MLYLLARHLETTSLVPLLLMWLSRRTVEREEPAVTKRRRVQEVPQVASVAPAPVPFAGVGRPFRNARESGATIAECIDAVEGRALFALPLRGDDDDVTWFTARWACTRGAHSFARKTVTATRENTLECALLSLAREIYR